ncbi:MAG: OmpA family protein, partial [Pseudomonadales bacterium]|nr:OmpA family protein [Pseudomonadales bacterium]
MKKMSGNAKLLAALFLGAVLAGCQSQPTEEAVDTAAAEVIDSGTHEVSGMSDSAVKSQEELAAETAQALLSMTVFYFDFDQAIVKSDAYDALQAHAAFLSNNPAAAIRLEGHADERGTREYNIALG